MWNIAGILILLSYATAHMDLTKPAPRRSKHMQGDKGGPIDYDMTSPLDEKFPYPCRGYPEGPVAPNAKYNAGDNIQVEIGGSAKHNGGHCWFAFSFDDVNFAVAKFVEKDCIIKQTGYQVPIPRNFPRGKVTFAWAWINNEGNDEYYMNCADIYVNSNSASDKYTGTELLVANVGSFQKIVKDTDRTNGLALVQAANKKSVTISQSGGRREAHTPSHSVADKLSKVPGSKQKDGIPSYKPSEIPNRQQHGSLHRSQRPLSKLQTPANTLQRPIYKQQMPPMPQAGSYPHVNIVNPGVSQQWRWNGHQRINRGQRSGYMPPTPGMYRPSMRFGRWMPSRGPRHHYISRV